MQLSATTHGPVTDMAGGGPGGDGGNDGGEVEQAVSRTRPPSLLVAGTPCPKTPASPLGPQ
eukprot:3605407-Prymnesium_polylepis.1